MYKYTYQPKPNLNLTQTEQMTSSFRAGNQLADHNERPNMYTIITSLSSSFELVGTMSLDRCDWEANLSFFKYT